MVAGYKLVSGAVLLSLGVGAFTLLPAHVEAQAIHIITTLHGDPNNRLIHRILVWIGALSPRTTNVLGAGALIYGALHIVEGAGLWLRKRWAEYFTVVITGLPLPFELYELVRAPTLLKGAALLVNALIVAYLVYHLRQERRASGE